MGYDDVIAKLGKFGRYQRRIFLVLYLPFISSAFHKMGGVFLSGRADFRCLIPGENPTNATYESPPNIKNRTNLWDHKTRNFSQCEIYDTNQFIDSNHTSGANGSSTISAKKCDSFVYDKSIYTLTATTQWDIVCDDAWLKPASDSLFMLGDIPGAVILGGLSDRYGRKTALMWGSIVQLALGLLLTVSPNFYTYILLRLFLGACSGLFLISYVTIMEMVVPKNRIPAGTSGSSVFALSFMLSSVLAYFIREWRYLELAFTVPTILLLAFLWSIPESARWLLNKGRVQEAKDILSKAFLENGIELSPDTLDGLLIENSNSTVAYEKTTVLDLLRYPSLRKKSLLLFFMWFVNGIIYYGLSWNASNLGGNHYLNFILSGAVELPAQITFVFMLDRWGKKVFSCGAMFLAGISLVSTYFVPTGMTWLMILLAMIGKLAIACSWTSAYVNTAEQYPTSIRGIGMTACSAISKIGAALAPYINYLFEISIYLPLVVLGSSALIAGLLSLLLPDTLNAKLLDTIQDNEEFGQYEKKTKLDIELLNDVAATKLLKENEIEIRQMRDYIN